MLPGSALCFFFLSQTKVCSTMHSCQLKTSQNFCSAASQRTNPGHFNRTMTYLLHVAVRSWWLCVISTSRTSSTVISNLKTFCWPLQTHFLRYSVCHTASRQSWHLFLPNFFFFVRIVRLHMFFFHDSLIFLNTPFSV